MNITSCLKGIIPVAAMGISLAAFAGNIPQYSFKETRTDFTFLTDATPVSNNFKEADEMVFPDRQTITAYSGEGFPIGFDFRYGGKVFNQFAIDNNGYILLGYDRVQFKGYSNLFFRDARLYGTNSFYMGLTPASTNIYDGEISYKTEGTAGDRRLTVEFAHLNVNEKASRGNAIYSLQIVLFEKTGEVQINFVEEESPYTSMGLVCGIQGWSNEDAMLLTSSSLADPAKVSSYRYADMLNGGSLLHWDADDVLGDEEDGHVDPYTFSFSFTPTGEPGFVCAAPSDLSIEQTGDEVTISCKRPVDAPATVIMFSPAPIEEFPEQGVSYPVKDDAQEYVTTFGNATLLYYNDDENPSATFKGVLPSKQYYVKAFGVNGYPSYSYDTSANLEFFSSHPAPYILTAASGDESISLHSVGDDQIIIAATLDRVGTQSEAATGIFGNPEPGCNVGDMIEGGGQVIYVGDPGDFVYTDAVPNREVFFRAWGLKDGRVSKTHINASGVTNPVLPYKPEIELYTLYEAPLNWIAQTTSTSTQVTTIFMPRMRGENDDEPAVGGVSAATTSTLISPAIPLGDSEATLRFEWAMETARDVSDQGDAMVVLPEGNEPGVFGAGHKFTVAYGPRGTENELFTATEYTGKMTPSPIEPDRYISGTSEFLPVEVKVPEGAGRARFSFSFSTEGFSILYLRKIEIVSEGLGKVDLISAGDVITGGEGTLTILSVEGGEYAVYSLDGLAVANLSIERGEGRVISLPHGVYVVNGTKVAVK